MIVARIPSASRVLGAPANWDSSRGTCGGLPVLDIATSAGPGMRSAWQPTPAELERLNAGASVYLTVLGDAHPPIEMTVGPAPVEAQDEQAPAPPPQR